MAQDNSPHLGSVRAGPITGVVLFMLLVASASLALWGDRVEGVPEPIRAAAPYAFGLFLAVFAAYRFALVRAGRYPAGKAYYQVGAGILFLTMLTPAARVAFGHQTPSADDLSRLMSSPDPAVRRLVCEVAQSRADAGALLPLIEQHLEDPDAQVRAQCVSAAHKLRGL